MAGATGEKGRCSLLVASLAERHGRAGLYRQHRRVGETAMTFNAMQFLGRVDDMVCVMDCTAAWFLRKLCLLVALEAVLIRHLGQKNCSADAAPQE